VRGIPVHVLIAGQALTPRLPAETVCRELAVGLAKGGRTGSELCPLPGCARGEAGQLLDEHAFDASMRAARAVVLAAAHMRERGLPGSVAFEIATRARQAGVPCYAVTGSSELDSFDARIFDLQLVLSARSHGALRAAGRRLAGVV
jgi:glycerate kinase